MISGPVASSWDGNSLDVWARGSNGQIWHRACRNLLNGCTGNSAFAAWESGAGAPSVGVHSTYSEPAAESWAANRVDLFVTGADLQLYHRVFTSSGWSAWGALGGALGSSPSVTSWGVDRLDIYARGQNGAAWHNAWQENQTWTGWESLNSTISSAPAVVNRGLRKVHVFAINGTNLWEDQCNGESNCRGITAGTLHKPSVAFAPSLTTKNEREVTSLTLPGTQSGCAGSPVYLYSSGSAGTANGVVRSALSCLGTAGCATQSTTSGGPAVSPVSGSWDNQILRGVDGHALVVRQTFQTGTAFGEPPERVNEYVYRSTDCGRTFTYFGQVDSSSVICGTGHHHGEMQWHHNAATGVWSLSPGGFDRFETYRPIAGGGLFLTASLSPVANTSTNGAVVSGCGQIGALFWSADGATWVKRQTLANATVPAVMTSSSSGNLYVAQCSAGTMRVQQFSNQGKTAGASQSVATGCQWSSLPMIANTKDAGGFYVSHVGTYADATDPGGFDVVRLIVPVFNIGDPDNDNYNYNELRIYSLEFRATFKATLVKTLSPSTGFSMRDISLIEPDLMGLASNSRSNVAVLTWRELKTTSGAGSESIKYVVLRDIDSISARASLSVTAAGTKVSWDWATDSGWQDYTKGSAYWDSSLGKLRFFAQWTQPIGARMQVFTNWIDLDE